MGRPASSHGCRALGGLGLLGLALAGCYPTIRAGTPEDALHTVVSLAGHGRTGDTVKVMTGPALEAFGTKKGLADLHEKLSRVVAMEPPHLVLSEQGDQGAGRHGDVRRIFTAGVSGRTREGEPAKYTVLFDCNVWHRTWVQEATPGQCSPEEKRPAGVRCELGDEGYGWDAELQKCRVSDIAPQTD